MTHHTQKGQPLSKNWMATIFDLEVDPKTWPNVKYCVWQKELCPTTKREHFQLFVQFEKRCRRTACLKLYKGDWRPARSVKNAVKYCQKEDTRIDGPWLIGIEPLLAGSKFHQIVEDLRDGWSEKKIGMSYPMMYIRYSTGIKRMRHLITPERTELTQLIWIWGPSGAGKSTYAKKMAKEGGRTVYMKDPCTKWWPLYEQEDVVIIDDFKGGMLPQTLFAMAGNSYAMQVEDKGSYSQFDSKVIIITSCRHPRYLYGEDTHAWQHGLERRVKGYTIWLSKEHIPYRTEWIPCYRDDPEEPPKAKRTKVIDDDSTESTLDYETLDMTTRSIENLINLCKD